jgi:hypothetical protein
MSAKGGGSSKKKMVTFSDQIPKKHRVDVKHCILCKLQAAWGHAQHS